MDWVLLIGFMAATGTTLSFIPQVIKSWKTKETHDISFWTFITLVIGIALWLIYGFLINDLPLIIANSITFVFALSILILKIMYK